MTNNTNSSIHIAITPWDLTDDYNRHAGVTLLSILDHCSQPVTAHILYDKNLCEGKEKETEYNKSCYQKIADQYNCNIEYHHVELPDFIYKLRAIKHYTPGSLQRLCLPELLPEVDYVFYIDCDTVVLTDISKLWNLPINEYIFAARCEEIIASSLPKNRAKFYKKTGISPESYFNSGVMLFNLDKIRKTNPNFEKEIFNFLEKNKNSLLLDQDALNWYVKNDYLHLDRCYNVSRTEYKQDTFPDGCICHYTTIKPWNLYSDDFDDRYWEYLERTPWCEDKKKFYAYLRSAPENPDYLNKLSKNIFRYVSGSTAQKLKIVIKFIASTTINTIKHTITVAYRELLEFL